LTLAQGGIYWEAFAPKISQARVYVHFHKNNEEGTRNVLTESARITRGKIRPLIETVATE
jgi:enhancing lycopene biosynthesis protein 2